MKKHTILVGALLAAAAMFPSCGENFLDTAPVTSKTDVSYYTAPAEFTEALIGCYDGLQTLAGNAAMLYLAPEIASDECQGSAGSGDDDQFAELNDFTDLTKIWPNYFDDNWQAAYKVLNRANTILSRIDQVTWDKESEKASIEAQTKFIRAFVYLNMVRTFGVCPLLTAPSNEIVGNATTDEIYALIFSDLKYASDNGLATAYDGHATKYAAEALLARAYLYYTGYYQKDAPGIIKAEVIAYLEDLKKNGGFALMASPFQLWPSSAQYKATVETGDFHNAYLVAGEEYSYAGELNKEVIFSIRHTYTGSYNGNTNDGNLFSLYVAPRCSKSGGTEGLTLKGMQKNGYASGWGIADVAKEFYDSFESGDKRRESSIIDVKAECGADVDNGCADGTAQYTGYTIKKYCTTGDFYVKDDGKTAYQYSCLIDNANGHMNTSQTQDFVIIRYADVLLMLAELKEDVSYINKVRQRAGLSDLAAYSKEALFSERAHELCFEGIRYWDMLRYDGKENLAYAKKALAGNSNGEYLVISGGISQSITIDYNRLSTTKGLFPIPLNQIDLSGHVIEQNEGWK